MYTGFVVDVCDGSNKLREDLLNFWNRKCAMEKKIAV
jgi:hypothetical protein